MDLDLTRLPTGSTGWRGLVDHALSLGDLSEVGFLELKGTLPFRERASRKRSAVVVSRAVLGMSNRMPEAAPHLGGYGVVLVGIQGRAVTAAEEVDGAVLRDALQPYLGEDGPRWDYTFINHPNGLVLAVVVDPPQWGDHIHACRKDYSDQDGSLTVRDGEVFVRHPGVTRPATSRDLAELERRRDQAPDRGAALVLGYDDGFDHLDPDNVPSLIEASIDRRADELLKALPTNKPLGFSRYEGLGVLAAATQFGDRRSPADFRAQVKEGQSEAREAVADVAADFFRYYLARGHFRLTNDSRKYLEAVRAQIYFPADVVVLAESDSSYHDHGHEHFEIFQMLPNPPARWGTDNGFGGIDPSLLVPRLTDAATWKSDAEVETTADGGRCVTWAVGDLRPGSTEATEELFAVYSGTHSDEVTASWKVTARGVDHVFEDDLRVSCAQEQGVMIGWNSVPDA